jgi:PhnB protein
MVTAMTTFALHLVVDDPDAAAAWYAEALGAREVSRVVLPGGRPLTVELRIGDTTVAVAGEMPGAGLRTPASLGGTPAAFHLSVPDVDAAWQRAMTAGATVFQPVQDAFWGDRTGQFLDPSGHRWALNQHLRDVPADEINQRAAELFAAP